MFPLASCKRPPSWLRMVCSKRPSMDFRLLSFSTKSVAGEANARTGTDNKAAANSFINSVSTGRRQHFALAIMPRFADHAGHFHGFNQARGAVVADLELALHRGNRGAPCLQHERHRFVIQRILFGIAIATALETGDCHVATAAFENLVEVVRLTTLAPVVTDAMHFLI